MNGSEFLGLLLGVLLLIGLPIFILRLRDRWKSGKGVSVLSGGTTLLVGLVMVVASVVQLLESTTSYMDIKLGSLLQFLCQCLMASLFIYFGIKWIRDDGPGIDEYKIDDEEPEVRASVQMAQKTINDFISQVENHIDYAYCRFALKLDEDCTCRSWGYVHAYENNYFDVSIMNYNDSLAEKHPSRMQIHRNDVEDWQIIQADGKLKGGYSYIAKFIILKKRGIRFHRHLRRELDLFLDSNIAE